MTGEIYHVGDLANDRAKNPALDEIATDLLRRAELGEVALCQRRLGEARYEYRVVELTHQKVPAA